MNFARLIDKLNDEYRNTLKVLSTCEKIHLEHPTSESTKQVHTARAFANGIKRAIVLAKECSEQSLPGMDND